MCEIWSASTLACMRAAAEATMTDQVKLLAYSESADSFNHPVPTWTESSTISCGITMKGGTERRDNDKTVVSWDAMIRLPIGTTFDIRDRVQVVVRFGEAFAPATVYEFAGPPQYGPTAILVPLKTTEPRVENV